MDAQEHYRQLFGALETKFGPLDRSTLTSVVGFSAGGPISLRTIDRKNVFVSCELSLYPEQRKSSEGYRFEFMSAGSFDAETVRKLFTALGALSMETELGDEHTIDVSEPLDRKGAVVILKRFSETKIGNDIFGIYEVVASKNCA